MRAYRQRQSEGQRLITLRLHQGGVDWLVRAGWLAEAERDDPQALTDALGEVINRAAEIGILRPRAAPR